MKKSLKVNESTKPPEPETILESDVIEPLCDVCIQGNDQILGIAFCKCCQKLLCHPCHISHQQGTTPKQDTVSLLQIPSRSRRVLKEKGKPSGVQKLREPVFIKEIDIQTPADIESASVCAMEALPNGFLLVCDDGNNKVKLFDNDFSCLSEVSLTSEPYGIVLMASISAIVNLPEENCLQKVRIKSKHKLALKEKRRTIFKCYKTIRYHDHLIVHVQDDLSSHINITDTDGRVLRCVYNEPNRIKGFLQNILSISLSRDGKIIYITDLDVGCVGLTLTGGVIFKYKEPGEIAHTGVCTDPDGTMYVCCSDLDKIVTLNEKGVKIQDFLKLKGSQPECIYYSDADSKMYIFSGSLKKLLCYEMKL